MWLLVEPDVAWPELVADYKHRVGKLERLTRMGLDEVDESWERDHRQVRDLYSVLERVGKLVERRDPGLAAFGLDI